MNKTSIVIAHHCRILHADTIFVVKDNELNEWN
jgi:ABC-type transport system involved in Fe-S cluster assembly fused permease/ATPase subunit